MKTLRLHPTLLVLALGAVIAGCSSVPSKTADKGTDPVLPPYKGGGYYKDDGPGANPPENLARIPDATPRWEPPHRFANSPYKVMGRNYRPIADSSEYKAKGLASWYGRKFHGKPTATGEPYDMYAMSAAHATLPLPSYARVTNLENGKSVVVRVNDRGPFHDGRIIDLSYTAAYKLDILKGVTPVQVESVLPETAPTSFTAQTETETILPTPTDSAEEAVTTPLSPTATATATPVTTTPMPLPVAVAAVPSEPAIGTGKSVYLQLGAFSNPTAADNLLKQVSTRLSRVFPGVMRLEVNGLHKIQAGPFASAEEADRAAAGLRDDLGVKAFKVATEIAAPQPITPSANEPANTEPGIPAPGLYLQFGAVSSSDAANLLANQVRQRFGAELPGVHQISAGNLYKIQAGPFATPSAAEQLALAYQQDFGVKPYRISR